MENVELVMLHTPSFISKRHRQQIIRPICRDVTNVWKQLGKGTELLGVTVTQTARKSKGKNPNTLSFIELTTKAEICTPRDALCCNSHPPKQQINLQFECHYFKIGKVAIHVAYTSKRNGSFRYLAKSSSFQSALTRNAQTSQPLPQICNCLNTKLLSGFGRSWGRRANATGVTPTFPLEKTGFGEELGKPDKGGKRSATLQTRRWDVGR